MPGRRDHARFAQLRRRPGDLQRLQRVHLAVPDRRHRQLAAGAARERLLDSPTSSPGTRCRRRTSRGGRPAPTFRRDRAAHGGGERRPGRRRAPRRGRPRSPTINLHTLATPAVATVTGNYALTGGRRVEATSATSCSISAAIAFPVLEGQTIGIMPPGTDTQGRPHFVRLYSVASPRDGERPRYNNVALTVKRVTEDHDGQGRCAASRRTTCATSPRARRST